MALREFELIDRFFRPAGAVRPDVVLGIGDDGALLRPPPGFDLVAVTDMLNEGVHFPVGCAPDSIGHRALAVNLSDIAAMGGTPAWALLSLALPSSDEAWLEGFGAGFSRLARAHDVALVGGDTTRGPLSVTVQVLGFVPQGQGLRRSGGQPGDVLFVSGWPGEAAAGLALEMHGHGTDTAVETRLRQRFLFPTPRLELGRALLGVASACLDVSDGLLGDLGKLAAASGCGALLELDHLPLSPELLSHAGEPRATELALAGGDDYELCFAVPPGRLAAWEALSSASGFVARRIGRLQPGHGVELRRAGIPERFAHRGFDHFSH